MPLPRVMDFIYQQKDSSKAISISNYLTKRARLENDSSRVSWGHYGNYLYHRQPFNLAYLDSLIYSTKGLKNHEEIFGLITNAEHYFYYNNDFVKALAFYLKARKLSIETKNEYYIRATTGALASIKFLTGEFSESLALYHRYGQMNPIDELVLYFDIANCHYELKNIDSLAFYTEIGIRKSLQKKDTLRYEYFLRLNGVSQYMQGNYNRALDSLRKSRALSMDTINLGSSYYHTALTHEALGNADSMIYYFKILSSLNQEPEIYFPEIKNVYYKLYENAKENERVEEQLAYIEKYIEADSTLQSKSKGLINRVDKDYDVPLLEERKNQLRIDQTNRKNLTYTVIALSVLLIVSIAYFTNRFTQQRKRLKEAIGNPENYLKTMDGPKPVLDLKKNILSAEIIEQLDGFFNGFEIDKQFLDPAISLQQLSLAAESNTSYLSNYLNTYKGGYSNYINSLRVHHAFSDMPTNSKIRIFTLDHIAKIYGFTSLRAFNRAFEKFLKLKPKDFLTQIKQNKQSFH